MGAAVTATGPAPRGAALRARKGPSARSARDAGLALAARPENAPSGSPSPAAPLTPPTARERLHSIACSWPRSFRRIARRRLSLRAPERSLRVAFGGPPLTSAKRTPSGKRRQMTANGNAALNGVIACSWHCKMWISTYKSSFLRFARTDHLAPAVPGARAMRNRACCALRFALAACGPRLFDAPAWFVSRCWGCPWNARLGERRESRFGSPPLRPSASARGRPRSVSVCRRTSVAPRSLMAR